MELEELKYTWKKADRLREEPEEGDILTARLRRRSRHPMAAMRRSLRWESAISVLVYIPLAVEYFFGFHGKLREVSVMLLLLFGFFIFYYFRKARLLQAMQNGKLPLRENLGKQLTALEAHLRLYRLSGILVPASMLFLAWLMYHRLPPPPHSSLFYRPSGEPQPQPLGWTLVLVGVSLLVYFADGWYLYALYGRYISRIRRILAELES